MGEQSVDLRGTLSILRRRRWVMVGAAAAGAAIGVGFAVVHPPMYTSTSTVLLQTATDANGVTIGPDIITEMKIASSDVVLEPAGRALKPRMSSQELQKQVAVSAPTTSTLQIDASAPTKALAQALAQAVASAQVNFTTQQASSLSAAQQGALAAREANLRKSLKTVNDEITRTTARKNSEAPGSPNGQADATALASLTAQQASLVLQVDKLKEQANGGQNTTTSGASIITHATPAVRPRLIERFVLFALLGLILTSAVAAGVVVSLSRRDRRLRYRDELADALGSPVIASIRSRTPRDVAGWMTLLEDYTPGTLDAWALRQALRHLVSDEADNSTRSDDGMLHHHPVSVTVLCLGDDPRGLATAPQIASYAASVGITTRLVAAHGHESAAALWAACAGVGSDVEVRSDLYVSTDAPEDDEEVDLTVVLAVVDRHDPQLGDLPATSETIIAVAPGVATAEDLARTAVVADDADRRIAGIVVADPDDLDRTTGRLLQHERAQQVPLPAHMTGRTAPKSGRSNVSGIRRRSG